VTTNNTTWGRGKAGRNGNEETQRSNERENIVGDKAVVTPNVWHVSVRSEDSFTGTNPYG
jgi:hypothetical protein